MPDNYDPNLVVGELALAALALAAFWRLTVWIRDSPTKPDPWDDEVARKLEDPETQEVCPHCSTPQPAAAWFCGHCGRAVGPYNNLMPYVCLFSEGEVFRNGTSGRFRNRPLIFIGYLLIALGTYTVFAPIFLFMFLLNWKRGANKKKSEAKPDIQP